MAGTHDGMRRELRVHAVYGGTHFVGSSVGHQLLCIHPTQKGDAALELRS